MIFTSHQIILGDQKKEHGMCMACDIYEKEEIFIHVLVVKTDVKRNLG